MQISQTERKWRRATAAQNQYWQMIWSEENAIGVNRYVILEVMGRFYVSLNNNQMPPESDMGPFNTLDEAMAAYELMVTS